MPRTKIGTDGNGRPIYSAVREFELSWGLVDATTISQLQTFFNLVSATGSVVVSLPKYANSSYVFYDYTGCVLQEPEWGAYFTEHNTEVVLLVTKIRT